MQLDQFKIKFIEEAGELISQLEESLLDNENNLSDEECVHQIFRVMHTLKGVSSMYGFVHIGDLAHDLETIFDLIRADKQEFTKPIFDITLKTVDQFRKLLEDEKLENQETKENQSALLAEIEKIVNTVNKPDNKNNYKIETSDNKATYYIIFKPDESILFRGVNIIRIFEELVDLGEYKVVNHAFKEHQAEFEDQNAWGIYLVSDKGIEAIEDVFMFVIDDCKILKVSDNNLFNFKEFLANLDSMQNPENDPKIVQLRENLKETIENINIQTQHKPAETNATGPEQENIEQQTEKPAEKSKSENEQAVENTSVSKPVNNTTSRISIDSAKLDRLMYLVSELVTTKSQLNLAVNRKDYTSLISIAEKIDDLSRGFRENALNIRLVPVAEMLMPFKRLIRDLSKELGKEVEFITQGIDTELDKNVIDRLSEPVMHILRNCVDHGIETPAERKAKNKSPHGTIKFTSFYSGANVFIQIQDDGAGLDTERIRKKAIEKGLINIDDTYTDEEINDLIFKPGFSTAKNVSDVSGRGVGMDIVRKKIEEVRGEVEINSEPGLGTFFTIKLHQTLSIIDTLLLQIDDTHYLVPVSDIEFCEQTTHEQLYSNQNRQVEIDNELIPFISIRDLFKQNGSYPKKEKLVIINKNDKRIAIVADKIIGEHQAVLKPLGEVFLSQQFLSGASMLGDGSLALMLDTNKLANKKLIEQAILQ